jgi:hypothetical protein
MGYAASETSLTSGFLWSITEQGRELLGMDTDEADDVPRVRTREETDAIVADAVRTQPRWIFDAALF